MPQVISKTSSEDFDIVIPILRAYRSEDGKMMIEGVASSTEMDSYDTIFNQEAQDGFAFDINSNSDSDEPVLMEAEHMGMQAPVFDIGVIKSATIKRVNEYSELKIEAELDEMNPVAVYYFNILSNPDPKRGRPKKLGLSINGYVVDAHYEFNEEMNKQIVVYDRAILKRVGIVRHPSNPSTWIKKIARSINSITKEENVMTTENNNANNSANEARAEQEVVVTPEIPAEVVAEVVAEIEETRSEEVVSEAAPEVEEVQRGVYDAYSLADSICMLATLAGQVSSYIGDKQWDDLWDEGQDVEGGKIALAKSALAQLKSVTPSLVSLLSAEVEDLMDDGLNRSEPEVTPEVRDATIENAEVHQDLSDDVTVVTPVEEVIAAVSEELSAQEVQLSVTAEELSASLTALKDEITSLTSNLLTEFRSSLDETLNASSAKLEELARKLEDSEKANEELVQRLEVVENSPASVPGAQLMRSLEVVSKTKREENMQRAKKSGNTNEMMKFALYPDYEGN